MLNCCHRTLSISLAAMFLIATATTATSQPEFTWQKSSDRDVVTSHAVPNDATVMIAPADLLASLQRTQQAIISIPHNKSVWQLNGTRFEVLAADAQTIVVDEHGEHVMATPEHVMLRGSVRGFADSRFFMAVFNNHVSAVIEFREPEGIRRYLLSPDTLIPNRAPYHILYEAQELAPQDRCRAEELDGYQQAADSIMLEQFWRNLSEKPGHEEQSNVLLGLQLAIECDSLFFARHSRNLSYASQYALTLAGACSYVYERDAGIRIQVPFLRVWTTGDGYGSTIGERLGNLRNRWNAQMGGVERAVTTLLSGGGGGGLAYVGVLCGGSGYNVSGVNGNVNFPATSYVWDIDVTSHELGHNIGSSHTHNCSWNPPIDSCWTAEGGCYDGVLPQRGSIMSYCHLQWQGTELEFHPRVATLVRSVARTRSCYGPLEQAHDTDVAVVNIIVPEAGAMVMVNSDVVPQVVIKNVGRFRAESLTVKYRILDFAREEVFSDSVIVAELASGALDTLVFEPFSVADVQQYLFEASVAVVGDIMDVNNQVTRQFQAVESTGGAVVLISPNGGEIFRTGDTVEVRFNPGEQQRVKIDVSDDLGETWKVVRNRTNVADTVFSWVVPTITTSNALDGSTPTCLLRIRSETNTAQVDVSDQPFSIVMGVDVAASDILTPAEIDAFNSPITPKIELRNSGYETAQNVEVRFAMRWVRSVEYAYDTTFVVDEIPPRSSIEIELHPSAFLASGVHTSELYVQHPDDADTSNNRFYRSFTASGLAPPHSVIVEHGPRRTILWWQLDDVEPTDTIEIWRSEDADPPQRIASLPPSVGAWFDDDVVDGTPYGYSLRRIRNNTASIFTDVFVRTPKTYPLGFKLDAPKPIAPELNSTDVPLPTSLVWQSVAGADRYVVQLASDQNFRNITNVIVTHASDAVPAPVSYDEQVWWRVRAFNETHNGPWGRPYQFSTTKTCAGNALSFNGSDANATNGEIEWNGGPITIEFWLFVREADRKNSSLFSFGANDDTENRLQAHVPWGNRIIYWDYGNIGEGGRLQAPFTGFDKWTHIALVSNGVNSMSIVVDAEVVITSNQAGEAKDLIGFTLGSMNNRNHSRCSVDEFRIWNTARTLEQIRTNRNREIPESLDGLVAFWRFDEINGNVAVDATSSGFNLALAETTERLESQAFINCTQSTPLGSPVFSNAQNIGAHDFELSWNSVVGAQWYELEVSMPRVGLSPVHSAKNITTNSYAFSGLPPSMVCTARVRAMSTTGASAWTTLEFQTPAPCEHSTVNFTANGSHFISESALFRGRATTVEYWAWVNQADVGDRSSMIFGTTDAQEERFQIHAPWRDQQVYFDFGDFRRGGRVTTAADNTLGKWTHFAYVSDGENIMEIYVDGRRTFESSFARNPGERQRLVIGANDVSNNRFRGRMANFRVWNVRRSEEQIRESMFATVTNASHLIGSWPLDEGSGRMVDDIGSSGYAANAGVDPAWLADTSFTFMQTAPVMKGPRLVQNGSMQRYVLHQSAPATVTWGIVGGELESVDADTAVIRWDTEGTRGEICLVRTFESGCIDSACYAINLAKIVGVSSEESNNILSVAPNPTSTTMHVTLPDGFRGLVTVVDLMGRPLYSTKLNNNYTAIDVSQWAVGNYVVVATQNNTTLTKAFSVWR